jgi:hypothetical protein
MDDHQRNIDQADNRYTGPETDGQYAPVPGFVQVHNQYMGNVCKKIFPDLPDSFKIFF